MQKRTVVVTGVAIVIVTGFLLVIFVLFLPQPEPVTLQPLIIGVQNLDLSSPIFIADEKGFFAENRLNVTLVGEESGVETEHGVELGANNVSGCSEYVFADRVLAGKDIQIITVFTQAQLFDIVARKDRGIINITDLNGKRIGYLRHTNEEFYLSRFLELNGINSMNVTLVNVNLKQTAGALTQGDVDAVVTLQPYENDVLQQTGTDAVVWSIQKDQPMLNVMVGKRDWIESHQDTVTRLVRSLNQAIQYIRNDPDDAKAIVQRRLNYTSDIFNASWKNDQFELSLDQSLIIAMEDESRWMIQNNLTNATAIPDFQKYIDTGPLETIKPDAVTIIKYGSVHGGMNE